MRRIWGVLVLVLCSLAPAPAEAAVVNNLAGSCAWTVPDTGCWYVADGWTAHAVVDSPATPTATGAAGPVTWLRVPGTTVWTASIPTSPGALVSVSGGPTSSGAAVGWNKPAPDPNAVVATLAGSGTYSPPLGMGSTSGTTMMTATAVGLFDGLPGSCGLALAGNIGASVFIESGSGSAVCAGVGVSLTCSLNWSRLGSLLAVVGGCSGTTTGTLWAMLAWWPTSINPTASYGVVGPLTIF